jgi:DNA-binding FrmR family transcriptional regulator
MLTQTRIGLERSGASWPPSRCSWNRPWGEEFVVTATLSRAAVDPVQARLHRIEGQASALTRMYEADRPTTDLLDLIAAIRAALGGLGLALISDEVAGRAGTAECSPAEDEDRMATVLLLAQRLVRCT